MIDNIFKYSIFILILTSNSIISFGQKDFEIPILIPNHGLLIEGDSLILKETNVFEVQELFKIKNRKIVFGSGVVDFTDGSAGIFYTATIELNKNIILHFKGLTRSDLKLDKIKINYPQNVKTICGISMNDHYTNIFNFYPKIEGSYNCGSDCIFCYCYPNEGIYFQVEPYREKSNPELHNKITSIIIK
jgi:hypothetical protein